MLLKALMFHGGRIPESQLITQTVKGCIRVLGFRVLGFRVFGLGEHAVLFFAIRGSGGLRFKV